MSEDAMLEKLEVLLALDRCSVLEWPDGREMVLRAVGMHPSQKWRVLPVWAVAGPNEELCMPVNADVFANLSYVGDPSVLLPRLRKLKAKWDCLYTESEQIREHKLRGFKARDTAANALVAAGAESRRGSATELCVRKTPSGVTASVQNNGSSAYIDIRHAPAALAVEIIKLLKSWNEKK